MQDTISMYIRRILLSPYKIDKRYLMTYKPRLIFLLISVISTAAFSQTPVITHVDKYVSGNAQKVTISGSNFGGAAANLRIWFGGVQGVVESATQQTVEATVPAGATYESIVITDITTQKSAWSDGEFMLSYGGEHPFVSGKLVAQPDLDAESGLYDLCMCDLDGDGMNDVAGANSGSVSEPVAGLSLFRNATAVGAGTLAFDTKFPLLPTTKALNIKCGDLDGDGDKDLVVTEADPGTRVFVLKNGSSAGTFSFAKQDVLIPGVSPKRVDIADLDGDGLPELIITDQNTANKDLVILPNTSSGAAISFASSIVIPVPSTGSDGLAIQDLNGDNRAEIIVSQILSTTSNVFVYKNESFPGTFDFAEPVKADIAPETPNATGAPVNIRIGDFDGDKKPDIAVTQFFGSKVSVLRNTGTSGSIAFAAPVPVTTDPFPFGLDVGDLDGDGKLDIVVASLTGPVTEPNPMSITILNNKSASGSISFETAIIKGTNFVNRHIAVGDLNGDSKPDIAYTSVDDNTRGVPASKISFFRNTSCIVPIVTPGGTMTVCSSFPVELKATQAAAATYVWKESGTANGTTTFNFTPSASGSYTVDITSDGCTKTSAPVNVTIQVVGAAAPPVINNDSPYCEGGTVNLSIDAPVVGETYNWTGPDGFDETGTNVSRNDYSPEFAGRYEVEVVTGGCIAAKASTLVETISLPSFHVQLTGSDVICSGTKTLNAVPADGDFTYQWFDEDGDIATGMTFDASATGSYSFRAKSNLFPGCPEITAEGPVDILVASAPVVAFSSAAETCKDVLTTFTNQSTAEEDAGPTYKWEFGDAATSTDEDATHTYAALGDLTVKLTISYRGDACSTTVSKPIKISAPPTATITTPNNVFEFCPGNLLTLGVSGTFNEYLWDTGATTATTDVTTGGTHSVQVRNSIGCKITVTREVTLLETPDIEITAEKNPINIGENTKLSATSGFPDYDWTPTETLDDPVSQTPVATPKITTTYTVNVVGANGCPGTAQLELVVNVDNPTNLLQPFNFFSPNGDPVNDAWKVINIDNFPQCGVTIFDEKGLKVYEAKPYNNDWDGTSNGKRLPDGVYYYMIRCDGDGGSKSGSITILR